MTIPYPQAKKLCTATEFQLLAIVRTEKLQSLKAAALKAKIARTRGLLDKWRDLGIQQARKAKAVAAPERTAQKVAWFTEALRRLEAQLGKLEKAAEVEAKQKALKTKAVPSKKAVFAASPRGGSGNPLKEPKAVETRAKVRQMRIAQSGLKSRILGHVRAAGKRNQAKRNAR